MGRITIDMTINAPVATVFAYVDDYRNTTKYMKDLVKWQPTGKVTHGKGAQFDVGMRAGPTTLTSVVDITTWTENKHDRRGTLSDGFKQIGKWGFAPEGREGDERHLRHGVRVRRRHRRQAAGPCGGTDRPRQPAAIRRDAQAAHGEAEWPRRREVDAENHHKTCNKDREAGGEKQHKTCNKGRSTPRDPRRKTPRESRLE